MSDLESNTTLKILVLCQLFYPELVSTGQTLTELCEKLIEMGVDIEVVCGPPTYIDRYSDINKKITYHGIKITRVWGTRFPKLKLLCRIINQITFAISVFFHMIFDKSESPILVLTNPPFLAIICSILKIIKNRPYIYLNFDIYPETAVKLGILKKNGIMAKIWEFFNRIMLAKAQKIIVIGRCMQKIIDKKMPFETVNKIQLIHIWSDDKLIHIGAKERNPYREKWRIEGKFVISYSGNMGRFHDMETIIKAARDLRDYEDIVFLFIGEGHKKRMIERYVKEWGLTNCQFHTYVQREDLGLSLNCADIGLVSLLEGQEGFSVPSKAFGLMSAGLPVIAVMSHNSEISKVILEEHCGYVVAPGDVDGLVNAILRLYKDKLLRVSLGNNARQAVDMKYSLNMAAIKYHEIIKELNNI
ncbi:MAG: glycosyltransferase family 4 protein [Bacteroidales bacterium]|nr:glycosyltransferase family 4 protein [Bacteroidales bacterium]